MAITEGDLRSFINFADEKLKNGGSVSLVELAGEWEMRHRGQTSGETNPAIQVDQETIRELAKAFPDVDDKQKLQQALARRGGVTTAEMLGKAMLAAARAGRL
jgi:hypothetical protein